MSRVKAAALSDQDERWRAAAHAGMAHYGYTPEQIAEAEKPLVHDETAWCVREDYSWSCFDEHDRPIHAAYGELTVEAEMAEVHLAAADAYDAAHNVHRVSLDVATVERAAKVLPHDQRCSGLYRCKCWQARVDTARAVLAAAVKEER